MKHAIVSAALALLLSTTTPLISNSQSIVAHDPGFAKIYLREKSRLLEVLQEGDPALLERARGILLEGMAILGMEDGPAAGQHSGNNEGEGLRP